MDALLEVTEADPEAVRWNNEAVALAQRGEFGAAVQSLRYARARDPRSQTIRKNLQQVLLAWGVERAQLYDWLQARDLLQEAYELGADELTTYWLATTLGHLGEEKRAIELLEWALERVPRAGAVRLALAELYEKQGLRAEALELFYQVEASGAQVDGLRARIERLERELDAEWEYESVDRGRFRFRYPYSLPNLAIDEVAEVFEAALHHVGRFLEVDVSGVIEVVLYDGNRFEHVTRAPRWGAGVYAGRIQLPLKTIEENDRRAFLRIARHEVTHALLAKRSSDDSPAWLDEGLALLAEEDLPGEHLAWAAAQLAPERAPDLRDLAQSFSSLSAEAAGPAYALSYRAVRELVRAFSLRQILQLLQSDGRSFEQRFEDLTGQSVEAFAESLSRIDDRR